jgi:hypothetical protein
MHPITEVEGLFHLHELLPPECIAECSASGDNGPACTYWAEKLGLDIARSQCIFEMLTYGAWTEEELKKETTKELNERYLWLAAGIEDWDD